MRRLDFGIFSLGQLRFQRQHIGFQHHAGVVLNLGLIQFALYRFNCAVIDLMRFDRRQTAVEGGGDVIHQTVAGSGPFQFGTFDAQLCGLAQIVVLAAAKQRVSRRDLRTVIVDAARMVKIAAVKIQAALSNDHRERHGRIVAMLV